MRKASFLKLDVGAGMSREFLSGLCPHISTVFDLTSSYSCPIHPMKDKQVSAQLMKAQGMTQKAIAQELGVTEWSIRNWLHQTGKKP